MVREWHSKLSQSVLAPATVARSYRILKALCATAVADELIPRNPCNVRGASTSKSEERPIATIEQVWKLSDATHPRYKTLILLATFTGLRLGELLALTRSDINLDGTSPYVAVRRQVFELQDGTHQFGPPKTDAGRRDVTLPPPLIPYLEAHLADWAAPGKDGLVFQAPTGGLIRRSNFNRRVWAPAVRSVGLTNFHFHDLRHTGNTLAAMTGASTRELMSRMGHASPRAALIYQHATRERDAEIAARLGAMFERQSAIPTSPEHGHASTKSTD
jgi:integrase